MLHIIGVSHFAHLVKIGQTEQTERQKEFSSYLVRTISQVKPALVGEEASAEGLADHKLFSITKTFIEHLKSDIEYRFCDPTEMQRKSIGYVSGFALFQHFVMSGDNNVSTSENHLKGYAIDMGTYFPVRERFWLKRLTGCKDKSAIFICGYGHLAHSSLSKLLNQAGIEFKIEREDVGLPDEEREDVQRTLRYLKEHPELEHWTSPFFPPPNHQNT
jgi:hypothetical protein